MSGNKLQRNNKYISSEILAYNSKYADPISLSYKLFIDYDKPKGLFADEKHVNSALAYLKRIGETERYEMLKHWIETFKIFLREYDFLFLTIEGLDIIQNANPQDIFKEEDSKLTFTIRETTDLLVQSLLTTYRHIWFDDNRMVEVLPINLRQFDSFVLVYNSGLFNEDNYVDDVNLPTPSKIQITKENNLLIKLAERFNHQLYVLGNCQINNAESGKGFTSNISNESVSDYVKNTLCFNYRFAHYRGRFNNTIGDFDFVSILTIMSEANKNINKSKNQKTSISNFLTKYKDGLKSSVKTNIKDVKDTLKTKTINQLDKIFGLATPIGNALNKISDPNTLPKLLKNTFDYGLNYVEDNYVNTPIGKLNNIVSLNFGSNIYDLVKNNINYEAHNKPKLINNPVKEPNESLPEYNPNKIKLNNNPVEYRNYNVYRKKGF